MHKKNGIHIGFCGIDGAGKTTSASRICKELRDLEKVIIFYDEARNFTSEIAFTLAKRNSNAEAFIYESFALVPKLSLKKVENPIRAPLTNCSANLKTCFSGLNV